MTSKQQQWRIPLKNLVESGKTFFDISVNTGQICKEFKADTLEKRQQHAHRMRLSDKDLVKKLLTSNRQRSRKKLLTSNRKIRLLVNNFLTRSLSEKR